ncbi:tyrosine-type recombinase/integrase [Streptomyces sp. CBMA152]|uniref:tyrosine-type recombinase/integrase n=1 Tax=Streptomyces sp. CBMA152 TaxID=1896312 RepID=UPI002948BB47|nr:tyrosine-type recombinase/integrase [Streptomyces sp. CBMA152]MBD0746028.1 hypothetical protein [Streptomyces sp. CBMA152]
METERVFTKENGEMLHPANVTRQFIEVYEEIGLPPVRLHDLHHGAATLARAGGADLKAIQEMLGHSSITITADTYTSLFPEADLAIAEAAARLVPRTRAPSENTALKVDPESDGSEDSGAESVPIRPLPGETPGQSGSALCPGAVHFGGAHPAWEGVRRRFGRECRSGRPQG